MKRNSGFTLIELIVVMVILGILAATAAPKFINLQSDAKIAALKGLSGAVNSAKSLVYAKALVQGFENMESKESDKVINGKNLALVWGYPAAKDTTSGSKGIAGTLDISVSTAATTDSSADWYVHEVTGSNAVRFVKNEDGDIEAIKADTSKCYVEYTQATSNDAKTSMKDMPTVKLETSGC